MPIVEKSSDIRVSVLPSAMQDEWGSSIRFGENESFLAYHVRGKVILPGDTVGKNVAFLFPSNNHRKPKNVDLLSGKVVKISRLVQFRGHNGLMVVPNEDSLDVVKQNEGSENGDYPVILVPDSQIKDKLPTFAKKTDDWLSDWVQNFTLRMVLETWDPYLLIDPIKYPNGKDQQRAALDAISLLDDTNVSKYLDPEISRNLRSKIIEPGIQYQRWFDNLRMTDNDVFKHALGEWSPRQRHTALYEVTIGQGRVLKGTLGNVIFQNPYNLLDEASSNGSTDVTEDRHNKTIEGLQKLNRGAFVDSPKSSLLHRLAITVQLAREHAVWFTGRDENNSEVLAKMNELREELPFVASLLRAVELTTEGQIYSDYLRGVFTDDPLKEAFDPAA